MNLFDQHINDIHAYMDNHRDNATAIDAGQVSSSWSPGGKRNIILSSDTAVELGHPDTASTSILVWTGTSSLIKNNRITVIGPDLPEARDMSLPFGRILMVSGTGFTEENCYDRYREMERLRFALDLKGYMLRAASQYRREWSRISRSSLDKGLTLQIIGAALLKQLEAFPWITGAELLYVTLSKEAVESLEEITLQASRIIEAMNRLTEDLSHNCGECDLSDVCSDVSVLQKLRRAALEKEKNNERK